MPDNVVRFKLPKKPRVVEKQAPPDQRKFCVVPMAALVDQRVHHLAIRVLALVCSYANRAGITWVGQRRIAEHLGITKQAVNKAIRELKDAGYLEVISRGFRGERADTIRVVYDPSISAEDAIAVTSSQEDTRPPHQAREESRVATDPEFTEEQMAANRARLREMLSGFRNDDMRYTKPRAIGEVMATRKPRAKKTQSGTTKPVDNTVDNTVDKSLHSQPMVNLQVDQTQKNIGIHEVLSLYEEIIKRRFTYVVKSTEIDLKTAEILCDAGVTAAELDAALSEKRTLLEAADVILNARVGR